MLIECLDLSYQYYSSNIQVFKRLSWQISEPGFHALFGPSGVGKTTLAKMTAGLLTGFSGKINVDPKTAILYYTYNLERLPGWSVIEEHLREIAPPEKTDYLQNLIESFGITECLKTRFSRLSLGQQNRTNLIRYLLQNFDLLIMDESLANVDEATRETIILEIKRVFSQKTFLYISHNVVEVAKFCKNILVLRDVGKSPQITVVKGLDHTEEHGPDQRALEQIMLEIVHAS
jgi:ABC-type multidrug transport system ATPase subunit